MSKCALKRSLRGLKIELNVRLSSVFFGFFFSLTVRRHSGRKKKVFITPATERGSEVEGETEAERAAERLVGGHLFTVK